MNEEKIIEYLENQDNSVNWNYSTLWAVKGLLDLYQKEKQKNKKYENKIKAVLELIDTKPYIAYTFYGDILYDDEDIRELLEEE